MKEAKQLILATRPYSKEIRSKSWWVTFSTLAALIAGFTVILSPVHWAIQLGASFIVSLLMVRFFIIYHDYAHRAILQRSTFASILFTIYGLFILAPMSIWRRSHDYHHKHNAKLYSTSIGSYPVVTKDKYKKLSDSDKKAYGFIRHPLTIGFGYIFVFIIGMLVRSLVNNPKKHWDSAISLALHVAMQVAVVYFFGWTALLFAILIPFTVACAMGSYLFYAQHNFPTVEFVEKEGWTFIKAALDSSSYMKMHPIMHWFTGNIGYHHIHHLNEAIPFYRLPEAYEAVPAFHTTKTTSLHPREILACLRLKVWDVENNKMVSWRELAS